MEQIIKNLLWFVKLVAHVPLSDGMMREYLKLQLDAYADTIESDWKARHYSLALDYDDLVTKHRQYDRQWEYAVAYHATRANWTIYWTQLIESQYRPSKIGLIKVVRDDLKRPDGHLYSLKAVKDAVEKVLENYDFTTGLANAVSTWDAKNQEKAIADLREKLTGTPDADIGQTDEHGTRTEFPRECNDE